MQLLCHFSARVLEIEMIDGLRSTAQRDAVAPFGSSRKKWNFQIVHMQLVCHFSAKVLEISEA